MPSGLDVALKTIDKFVCWEVPHNGLSGVYGGVQDMGLFSDGSILVNFHRKVDRDGDEFRLPYIFTARLTPDGEEVIWLKRRPTLNIISYYASWIPSPNINANSPEFNSYARQLDEFSRFIIDPLTDTFYMAFAGRAGRYVFELGNSAVPYDIWKIDIDGNVIWKKGLYTTAYQNTPEGHAEINVTYSPNFYSGTNKAIYNRKPLAYSRFNNRLYVGGSYGNISIGFFFHLWALDADTGDEIWSYLVGQGSEIFGLYLSMVNVDPFNGDIWYATAIQTGQHGTAWYIITDNHTPENVQQGLDQEGSSFLPESLVTLKYLKVTSNPNRIPGTLVSPYPGVSVSGTEIFSSRSVNWDVNGNPILGFSSARSNFGAICKLYRNSLKPMWGYYHRHSRGRQDFINLTRDRRTIANISLAGTTGLFGSVYNVFMSYYETRIDKDVAPILPKRANLAFDIGKSIYPDNDTTIDCIAIHTRFGPVGDIEQQMALNSEDRPVFAAPFLSIFTSGSATVSGTRPFLTVHQAAHIDPDVDPDYTDDPNYPFTYQFYYEPGRMPSNTPYEFKVEFSTPSIGHLIGPAYIALMYPDSVPYWYHKAKTGAGSTGGTNNIDDGVNSIPGDDTLYSHFPPPLEAISMWDTLNPNDYVAINEIKDEFGNPSLTSESTDGSRWLVKSEFAPVLDQYGDPYPGYENEPTKAGLVIFTLGPICAPNALSLISSFFPRTYVGNKSIGGIIVKSTSVGWAEQNYVPLKRVRVTDGTNIFEYAGDPDNFEIWPNGAIIRFPIKFTPPSEGIFTGKVEVVLDCAGEDTFLFDIEGEGVNPPDEPQKQVPGNTALDTADEIESEEATYEVDPSTKRPIRRL